MNLICDYTCTFSFLKHNYIVHLLINLSREKKKVISHGRRQHSALHLFQYTQRNEYV